LCIVYYKVMYLYLYLCGILLFTEYKKLKYFYSFK